MALKMGRATGWDLFSGSAKSKNVVCQDLSASHAPFLHLYLTPSTQALQTPTGNLHEVMSFTGSISQD